MLRPRRKRTKLQETDARLRSIHRALKTARGSGGRRLISGRLRASKASNRRRSTPNVGEIAKRVLGILGRGIGRKLLRQRKKQS